MGEIAGPLLLVALGAAWAVVGLLAWTGRWRGWIVQGRGYRWLMGVAFGPGLALLGLEQLLDALGLRAGDGVLSMVGIALMLVGVVYMLLTLAVKDRFYPSWYRRLPESEQNW